MDRVVTEREREKKKRTKTDATGLPFFSGLSTDFGLSLYDLVTKVKRGELRYLCGLIRCDFVLIGFVRDR